jgi:ankyrin repeat protein
MGNIIGESKRQQTNTISLNTIFDNIIKLSNREIFEKIKNHIENNKYRLNFQKELEDLFDRYNTFDINTRGDDGKTLLHIFSKSCDTELIKKLISLGADVNIRDNLGKTPIFYSYEYKLFIDNGCDINIRDNENHTVLYYVAKMYRIDLIKHFIDAGAEYDIDTDFEPEIQLHIATLFGNIPKMREILDRDKSCINSNITRWNWNTNITPLYVTCENGLYDELLVLLEYGADIHHPEHNYLLLILRHATHKKSIDIFRHLIKLGLDVNKKLDNDETLLHNCFDNLVENMDEFIDVLIENGADIHAKSLSKNPEFLRYENAFQYGAEPLHHISKICCRKKVFETFFKHGADPNIPNNYGITPFMVLFNYSLCLSTKDAYEIIQLFIDNGADIYQEDERGVSAIDIICNGYYITDKLRVKIIQYLNSGPSEGGSKATAIGREDAGGSNATARIKNMFRVLKPSTNQVVYNVLYNKL